MPESEKKQQTLGEYASLVIKNYFDNLDGQHTTSLYDLVIDEVEKPLLMAVLEHTNYNQTISANILGISRVTLRKKMLKYQMLKDNIKDNIKDIA